MTQALHRTRPLIAFDLETTGLDVLRDRIIELCLIRLELDGSQKTLTHRIHPQQPIPAQATAVHHIRDEDVADAPTFAELAPTLIQQFEGCDLTGFNIEKFDIPILQEEFRRAGIEFRCGDVCIVDTAKIYWRQEPRDLKSAFKFYCQQALEHAHSAQADAQASLQILFAQMEKYTELPRRMQDLHAFCHPQNPNWVDPDGKIIWQHGEAVIGFGKHRNRSLRALAQEQPDYLQWICSKDFSIEVRKLCEDALSGTYPSPPAPSV